MKTPPQARKLRVIRAIESQARQAVADGGLWSDPLIAIADGLHASGASHLAHRNYAAACDHLLSAFLLRRLIRGDGDLQVLLFATHLALSLDLLGSPREARQLRELTLRQFRCVEATSSIKTVSNPADRSLHLH